MKLTVGPNQFFWKPEEWSAFYTALAEAPVERVVLGELVCSKRLPFYQDRIPAAIEALQGAGKAVAVTSLALITLKRERKLSAELIEAGVEVEINDLTMLAYLPEGAGFSVGPLVNVYNDSTLSWLAGRGATSICLPPELPLDSVERLAHLGRDLGVAIEVWGHGRVPLAISGRCYHARLHGHSKDNCRFACEDDPDGLKLATLEGQDFLAINGVQTLSDSFACADHQIERLRETGVTRVRLSPHSGDFAAVCALYRARIDGQIERGAVAGALKTMQPGIPLSDGFLTGTRGAEWSGDSARTSSTT
ncbi:U32 family peptidase [Pseudooceanicola sp.]|uniref:ubiquinone anaerobic biosynthesis protein UbiV n=1 Tax=Pseudooceanicola sp. TaxID=1914328 RepID=UPI002626E8B5|nr:U32 family peptidase [Pseudooceanicola sp.]MDF1854659.1 U32 family peptidase [Pseudooceanicola sp.]